MLLTGYCTLLIKPLEVNGHPWAVNGRFGLQCRWTVEVRAQTSYNLAWSVLPRSQFTVKRVFLYRSPRYTRDWPVGVLSGGKLWELVMHYGYQHEKSLLWITPPMNRPDVVRDYLPVCPSHTHTTSDGIQSDHINLSAFISQCSRITSYHIILTLS